MLAGNRLQLRGSVGELLFEILDVARLAFAFGLARRRVGGAFRLRPPPAVDYAQRLIRGLGHLVIW
jgi:hypothetical protein